MNALMVILQCSWGILQTTLGFLVFVLHGREPHFFYHGVVVTRWKQKSSLSLGLFVFLTDTPYFSEKFAGKETAADLSARLLVHEAGHAVQSLLLGPLYLIVIGIPSTLWGFSPALHRKRREKQISYFSFFTEKWANRLGEKLTKAKSMESLVID